MNTRIETTQQIIISKYNLHFTSRTEREYFFRLFYSLFSFRMQRENIIQRNTKSTRRVRYFRRISMINANSIDKNTLDVEICLAALCVLNWPGKTPRYRQEIKEYLNQYTFASSELKIRLLSEFKKNINPEFKYIQAKPYFTSIEDLVLNTTIKNRQNL